jgi:hypothetical protein
MTMILAAQHARRDGRAAEWTVQPVVSDIYAISGVFEPPTTNIPYEEATIWDTSVDSMTKVFYASDLEGGETMVLSCA